MESICGGVVTYNPDFDLLVENITAVKGQVKHLYIADNGSENIEKIKDYINNQENITLIELGENKGIACALNILCQTAYENEYSFLLTLDQDSVVYDNLIEKMLPFANDKETAIIAPSVNDDNENDIVRSSALPEVEDIERANTSGCLTSLYVWKEIGGFDERMFIDCVDFDYCTTALKKGYRVIRVNNALIHHRLGEAKEVKFFTAFGRFFNKNKLKRPLYTYNHSPLRTYYYARNIRYYIFKHKDYINLKQERRTYIKWFVLKVFFEKQKLKKLFAIIKGTIHSRKLIKEYKKEIK